MTKIDPAVSAHMSNLAKRRKNPYLPFKDPEVAKAASLKGVAAQKAKRQKEKRQDSIKGLKSEMSKEKD